MAGVQNCGPFLDYRAPAWNYQPLNPKTAMREVQGKHIVVIGAARSGMAVASLLKRKGASVFVTDKNAIDDSVKARLNGLDIPYEEKGHTETRSGFRCSESRRTDRSTACSGISEGRKRCVF